MLFEIRYYDEVLTILSFTSRKDAVQYAGIHFGGRVGINVNEIK